LNQPTNQPRPLFAPDSGQLGVGSNEAPAVGSRGHFRHPEGHEDHEEADDEPARVMTAAAVFIG
jgi:hypothetical protein